MDRKEKGQGNMALYTFIMEYDGGTYVSQEKSDKNSMRDVVLSWAKKIEITEIEGMGQYGRQELLNELEDEGTNSLVSINDVHNVWYTAAVVNDKVARVNIIKTAFS